MYEYGAPMEWYWEEKTEEPWMKSCPSATLSTRNHTQTGPGFHYVTTLFLFHTLGPLHLLLKWCDDEHELCLNGLEGVSSGLFQDIPRHSLEIKK
jgi:hypothetical protein